MRNWVNALVLSALLVFLPAAARADECFKTCVTSPDGVAAVQLFEGFSPFVYKDSGGLATIGYGHLIVTGEEIPQPLLGDAAVQLLRKDLKRTERGLNARLDVTLQQHQFDALTSFAFNVGVNACTGSTLFRYVNAERYDDATGQFRRWVYVGQEKVTGLSVRRAAEAKMFAGH